MHTGEKRYKITVKKKGQEKPETSFYRGHTTMEFLIRFLSVERPGVEWYRVEVTDPLDGTAIDSFEKILIR